MSRTCALRVRAACAFRARPRMTTVVCAWQPARGVWPGTEDAKPHMTLSLGETDGREDSAAAGRTAARREVSILYAEGVAAVADAVRETLEVEGWRVEVCARGDEALRRLLGGERFDLFIFDFPLAGLDGVELTRRVRGLPRRAHTPIIMLTDSEVEREARSAGVDAFLRKPRGVYSLAETAARLLARART